MFETRYASYKDVARALKEVRSTIEQNPSSETSGGRVSRTSTLDRRGVTRFYGGSTQNLSGSVTTRWGRVTEAALEDSPGDNATMWQRENIGVKRLGWRIDNGRVARPSYEVTVYRDSSARVHSERTSGFTETLYTKGTPVSNSELLHTENPGGTSVSDIRSFFQNAS